jgi:hypothetical protein
MWIQSCSGTQLHLRYAVRINYIYIENDFFPLSLQRMSCVLMPKKSYMQDKTVQTVSLTMKLKEVHFEQGLQETAGRYLSFWNSSVHEVPDGGMHL